MKINQIDNEITLPYNYNNNNNEFFNRKLKENRGRINNINYEILQMNLKDSFSLNKTRKINFFEEFKVSNEDFEKAKEISEQLINEFNPNLLLDMMMLDKLISIQKHLMELFNYIIYGDQNFDWNLFKRKINYNIIISKMKEVNYDYLDPKQFNFYLNRFLPKMELPKFIPVSNGMNHLYKWIKCQITIYIYLINSKQINKSKISMSKISNEKSLSTNNDELSNIYFDNKSMDFIVTNREKENIKKEENNLNYLNNIMITNLPIKISPKYKRNYLPSLNRDIKTSKSKEAISKNLSSFLKYNALNERIKREEKVIKFLPLLDNRTFGQMRKFYNIRSDKYNKIIEQKHFDELQNSSIVGIKNKNKIVSMISNNKMSLIGDIIVKEKLDEILE